MASEALCVILAATFQCLFNMLTGEERSVLLLVDVTEHVVDFVVLGETKHGTHSSFCWDVLRRPR